MSKKRFFVIAMLLVAMVAPIFAATGGDVQTDTAENFLTGIFGRVLMFTVGILGGGFLLVKGGIDIFHAIRTQSDDPNAMRKAVIQLVFGIIFLGGYLLVAQYVIPSGSNSASTTTGTFLNTVNGVAAALVNL